MFIISIEWPSNGEERYSYVGQTVSGFTGNVQGRLISVSELTRAMREDKEMENSTVTVVLADTDNYFSDKLSSADQYIKGQTLSVYDDTTLVFTGYITHLPEVPVGQFAVTATLFDLLDVEINTKITAETFASADAENLGQYGNYIFGLVSDADIQAPIGKLIAYRVDTRTYLAAWHHLYEVTNVYSSVSESEISDATWSLDNNADGNAYIVFSTDIADDEIQVGFNAYGYKKDSTYMTNPITALDTLNTELSSPLTFDGISDAETEATSRLYVCSFAITDGVTWKQFLAQFARNFDLYIWQKINGEIGIKMMDWGYEESSKTISTPHIIEYSNRKDITQITSRIRRMYEWHIRKMYFAKLPIDITARSAWVGKDVNLDLRFTSDDSTSADVAQRYMNVYQDPLTWIRISVDKETGKDIDLGDVITVTYPKGYYPNGEIESQVFRKTHKDTFITIDLLNIGVIEDGAFRLWELSDPKIVLLHDESDPDCEVLL